MLSGIAGVGTILLLWKMRKERDGLIHNVNSTAPSLRVAADRSLRSFSRLRKKNGFQRVSRCTSLPQDWVLDTQKVKIITRTRPVLPALA